MASRFEICLERYPLASLVSGAFEVNFSFVINVYNFYSYGDERVSFELNLLLMFSRSFFKRPFNTSSKVQIRRQPTQTTQKDPNGKVRNVVVDDGDVFRDSVAMFALP